MNTIVSAFVSKINTKDNNTIEQYYKWGKILLDSEVPKIIFVDKLMYDCIGDDYDKLTTHLILMKREEIYLYDYYNNITKFNPSTDNVKKDTIDFMFIMCHKSEWVREAIKLNTFNSKHFIWVDFGIRHIIPDKSVIGDILLLSALSSLKYKHCSDGVRMCHIWDLNKSYNFDLYELISWYFAGGVFGGDIESLLKFADLNKQKCIDIINTKNTITWEVNIWYIIYTENKDLFNVYNGDHNLSILLNY